MRRLFILVACFSLLLTGWAFAGTPKLENTTWEGTYDAIRPDGSTFDNLDIRFKFLNQFGSLFQGESRVEVPMGAGTGYVNVNFTLNISQDKRIFGIVLYPTGEALTLEGKWNGNKTMTGVAIDSSDGSTTVFTVFKVNQE